MTSRSQPARPIALAIVAALATSQAHADEHAVDLPAPPEDRSSPDDALALAAIERARPPRRRKPVRFSNGPRAVPRPRGSSLTRAASLGIGSHLATKHLLWSRPGPELLRAVPGPRPRSLLWPVVGGRWGRGFGYTRRVRTELRHNGIDIGAPAGTPIRAAEGGLVLYSDNTLEGLGNCVLILHPGGLTTLYGHNQRNTVQAGWYVQRGERIALVGQTGAAWGPHLHFELRDNGRWRDPAPFITGYRDPALAGPLVELSTGEAPRADERPAPEAPAAGAREAPGELPFPVGTLAAARRLLRAAPDASDDAVLGRKFSNLLWPVKGGSEGRGFHEGRHRALDVNAAAGAAVRVAADGVVVYSGDGLRGYGHAIVVLHRGAWVTVYGSVRPDGAAQAGTRVLRGEWIGRIAERSDGAAPHLHFEWLASGKRSDPSEHFVGR